MLTMRSTVIKAESKEERGNNFKLCSPTMSALNLAAITAPMVNQSDLPFRTLTHKYGATITYTQMLHPDRLLNDADYFEFHQRDLTMRPLDHQVVVQLCGNESALVVKAAKKIQQYCDAIGVFI